jgi:hypothetical protein
LVCLQDEPEAEPRHAERRDEMRSRRRPALRVRDTGTGLSGLRRRHQVKSDSLNCNDAGLSGAELIWGRRAIKVRPLSQSKSGRSLMSRKPKLPKALLDRVEHFDDERAAGNGYIITLKAGWTVDPLGHCAVFGEDTLQAVRVHIEMARACDCLACRIELAKTESRWTF